MKVVNNSDIVARTATFERASTRRILHKGEWWFSIEDLVALLTDGSDGDLCWRETKERLNGEGCEIATICRVLNLPDLDGKRHATECVNAEGFFRVIQSIRLPKAELFKRWLAKVGIDRIQEIENPELAMKWTRLLYKLKGYSDDWIEKRILGIAVHEKLSDEWQKRGAATEDDHEILTAEISKAAFGVTPAQYKTIKGLKRENLRDHMDDFELIFTMLGERSTTEIHREEDSRGVPKLTEDAKAGGKIAGDARKALEKRLKRPIVSSDNFLRKSETQKRLKS
jgi:hypothetical protein